MYYYTFLCYLLIASMSAHFAFQGFRAEGVPPEKMEKDDWCFWLFCTFTPGVNLVVLISIAAYLHLSPLLRLFAKEREAQR